MVKSSKMRKMKKKEEEDEEEKEEGDKYQAQTDVDQTCGFEFLQQRATLQQLLQQSCRKVSHQAEVVDGLQQLKARHLVHVVVQCLANALQEPEGTCWAKWLKLKQ